MVMNHLLSGMILQVCPSISFIFNDRLSAADRGSKPWNGSAQKAVTVLEQVGWAFFGATKKVAEMPKLKKSTIEINLGIFGGGMEKIKHHFTPFLINFKKKTPILITIICPGNSAMVTNPTHPGNTVGKLCELM